MTENWYIVLELEFDPNPVNDESIIEERIEEKRKFWSSKANDFNHGPAYRKYSQMLPEIKKAMLGEGNIRAQLIKEACEKTYGPIDKILKGIRKAEIPIDTIEKIAKKQKVDVEIVKRRATGLGIKIGSSKGGDAQGLYQKYYKTKPKNWDKYNGMKQMLATFNVDNLYDFLYAGTGIKNAFNQPCDALRQRANEKKRKEFYKNDSISGTGSKICGQCEETFKDDSVKKIYDDYIDYNRRKSILDTAKEIYEYSGEISPEGYADTMSQLTKVLKDRKLAESVFVAFCKVEKIPLALYSEKDQGKNSNIKICRCGSTNDISDGRKICKACGLELQIKCPKCKTVNDGNTNVCKCGFKFENIDKALALCELASDAIEHMVFNVAKAHLKDVEKYWPGSQKAKELKARLLELEDRVGGLVDEMGRACNKKMYYAAQKAYENIKRFSPNYVDLSIESEIKGAIEEAKKYKKIAQNSSNETDIVEACTKAYEACNDYPGINEIIAKYPPREARNLKVLPDPLAKINVLSWDKSSTAGLLYYIVVRKEGAMPISIEDGKLIGRVSMCSINDMTVLAGVEYFYGVFVERAGVYSKGLVQKEPVINLFEISGVQLVSGDGRLQFSWDPFVDNASVEIEREENGKVSKLTCNNRSSYLDKNLKNDMEYKYRLFLSYSIGNKKIKTKGITIFGTPTKPPMAIDKLLVKPLENNEFFIEWENPENGEVEFYYSERKPDFLYGDLLPLLAIEKSMRPLLVKKKDKFSGTFTYEGEDLIYVVALVVKSGSAVIGTIARASKGGRVKIHSVNLVNGKILISTDLPKGATGFVVLYRQDQFPEDISDVNTRRKYIPLKQYQFDSGLLIDANEPKNYYFSVFAEFKRDGEKDYSTASDYLFSNISKEIITYSLETSKRLFGPKMLTITFKGDKKQFTLPDIDIMSMEGVAPMFKKSAKLFYEINSQEVNGSAQIKIQVDKNLPKETYIKAFLKDESLQGRYQLKLKVKSQLKIS